jgi:hypothetical protein
MFNPQDCVSIADVCSMLLRKPTTQARSEPTTPARSGSSSSGSSSSGSIAGSAAASAHQQRGDGAPPRVRIVFTHYFLELEPKLVFEFGERGLVVARKANMTLTQAQRQDYARDCTQGATLIEFRWEDDGEPHPGEGLRG